MPSSTARGRSMQGWLNLAQDEYEEGERLLANLMYIDADSAFCRAAAAAAIATAKRSTSGSK